MSENTLRDVAEILAWKDYARSTRSSYMLWIKKFLVFHKPYGDPKTCKSPKIEEFIANVQEEKPLSYSSYNILLSSLTFLYDKVYKVKRKKEHFLRKKAPYEITPSLGENKILAIIRRLPIHYEKLALLILYTGLTSVEATTLKREDVDLKSRELTVRGRLLVLPEQAITVLTSGINYYRSKWIFPSVRDSSARINPCLDVSGFNRALYKASRTCGLSTKQCINARSIRNLYALLELKKGVHPMTVQANLGTDNRNVIFMHMELKARLADD